MPFIYFFWFPSTSEKKEEAVKVSFVLEIGTNQLDHPFLKYTLHFTVKSFPISISIDSPSLHFAFCLLLQPSPCGFSEDQGLLNNHGWVFSPQKLNLHLLPHRAQLQRQVGKCQTLLGTVAVGPRRGVANHLLENQG